MNPLKARAIEIAARAHFEAMKASVVDMSELEWDAMPETEDRPGPKCKQFYRDEVMVGVEALARAHMLREPIH